jgi:nucleotide-binding universal stress UspA family protein
MTTSDIATRARKHIVVGVDGSAQSSDVLRWAVEQARATAADITVVMAWQATVGYGYVDVQSVRDSAQKSLQDVVNTVADAEVSVTSEFIEGYPSTVLLEASQNADLLVVGNRGHGGFTGMLLGSVSTQCLHHATCPVVVVRSSTTK